MRLEWICDGCQKPVEDAQGWIVVDWLEANRRIREWDRRGKEKEREAERTGGFVVWNGAEILEMPGQVGWEVWHRNCDPNPERDDYWFAVERCRTLEHLLEWNAHLAEKRWITQTDWFRFIQLRVVPGVSAKDA